MFGYSAEDKQFAFTLKCKKLPVRIHKDIFTPVMRRVQAVSLGPHLNGYALPIPNNDFLTLLAGSQKRINAKIPKGNKAFFRLFARYCKWFNETYYTPLKIDELMDFEAWLSTRNLPGWRKEELRKAHEKVKNMTILRKYQLVRRFMKWEFYEEPKAPRNISPYPDEFKVITGPIHAPMEEQIMKLPWFIHRVPVPERARWMEEKFSKYKVMQKMNSDYSSWELSIGEEMLKANEVPTLKYFYKNFSPDSNPWKIAALSLKKINAVYGNRKDGIIWETKEDPARQSGKSDTYFANSDTNLKVSCFLSALHHFANGRLDSIYTRIENFMELAISGDDKVEANHWGQYPDAQWYRQMGIICKTEFIREVGDGSFCGLIYHPDVLHNLADPYKHLMKFGYTKPPYAKAKETKLKALLRVKGFSYCYEYGHCPILGALGEYACRVTSGIDVRTVIHSKTFDSFKRERLINSINSGLKKAGVVDVKSRILFEKMYKITVEEQLRVEAILNKKQDLRPLDLGLNFDKKYARNYENYVYDMMLSEQLLFIPRKENIASVFKNLRPSKDSRGTVIS